MLTNLNRLCCFAAAGLMACSPVATPRPVVVSGTDYAFSLPDTIPPGSTAFRLDNTGQVDHEMVIARLKPGLTLAKAWETMQAGGDEDAILDESIGVLFAKPGQGSAGQLLVDLVGGSTYALMCFLQNTPSDPPHTALGMMASIEVR